MSELIGAAIEFVVRKRLLFKYSGNSIRRLGSTLLDQSMNGLVTRKFSASLIPTGNLSALLVAHQTNRGNGNVGIRRHLAEQANIALCQLLYCRGGKEVGAVAKA